MIGTSDYKKKKDLIMDRMDISLSSRMVRLEPISQYNNYYNEEQTFQSIENMPMKDILSSRTEEIDYQYLENNLLSQTFSLCSKESDSYNIHFCI